MSVVATLKSGDLRLCAKLMCLGVFACTDYPAFRERVLGKFLPEQDPNIKLTAKLFEKNKKTEEKK